MLAGQRIMIVDDDPGIRRALHILLSREGYLVT
jgi:DNA-binding NtrC family response regulator